MSDAHQDTQNNDTPVISTRHAGKMKTLVTQISYKSDLLHQFLSKNEIRMLNAFERLGAIFRIARTNPAAYDKIRSWHYDVNLLIARTQLDTLQELRAQKQAQAHFDGHFELNRPECYEVIFEVSHPVGITIPQLIKEVDAEIDEIETLFMFGMIDDTEYAAACKQASVIISGVVDRLNKVTAPGKREGGSFSPRHFVEILNNPNFELLAHCGMPMAVAEQILTEAQLAVVRTHHSRPKLDDHQSDTSEGLVQDSY
ncbi:hypothetical protein [Pseudoalteromonas rubra]|uniref:Uncharacterized protein n=1 Tax=Pseudoalteromonas rubra TaxID=43658 RepID=A0A0U2ZEB3_9GAMM|nr:hypothetical protein [Pseudoalteromonas rubra]ALU46145.1 hypothetical protein AT705_24595 [Pseudoalteromonas rubra]